MVNLGGKWIWIWNWRRCDGGDPQRVAARLKAAGCRGAIIKAHDGPHWRVGAFDQGRPWPEIAEALMAQGLKVGGWGYFYGQDPAGEAQRAIETIDHGQADLYVFDMEGEFKAQGNDAATIVKRVRQAVGPDYPLYVSTFAFYGFHRDFDWQVAPWLTGWAPQVYWNVFAGLTYTSRGTRYSLQYPAGALPASFESYQDAGLLAGKAYAPVAGLYANRNGNYPTVEHVQWFVQECRRRRFPWCSFWSYQHMDEAMWQAVAAVPWPAEGVPWTGWTPPSDPRIAELQRTITRLELELAAGQERQARLLQALRPWHDALHGDGR